MPPRQSKCCGCCCTSRIGVMAYCTLSAVLYLLSIVTFFPLNFYPQPFTFIMGNVVGWAHAYCRDYTCNEVCMCGDLPCDFEAQGAMIASGGGLEFACTIMSIVLYTLGGAWAARDYRSRASKSSQAASSSSGSCSSSAASSWPGRRRRSSRPR